MINSQKMNSLNKTAFNGHVFLVLCGFVTLCLFASFFLLSQRTLDSHECFVSVTAREMIETDNWVFPTMNGQPRLNKTPLQYWLVASMSFITGQIDEFTARFPSAVFGFLSGLCIYFYLKKWLGFRAGVICAAVWITTVCFMRYSRNARPEMGLMFFVLLCYLSFWDAINSLTRHDQIISMFVFWVSLSLGMLQKGPAPLAYIFLPLFVYMMVVSFLDRKYLILSLVVFWVCLGIGVLENNNMTRVVVAIPLLILGGIIVYRQRKTVARLLPIVGPILFLAILLPWPLFIGYKIHWKLAVWQNEYVDRLSGDYAEASYPIYFYVLMLFKYITPWVVFVPMALMSPFYRIWKKKQPLMIYLLTCFVATFIFLTIDQGKRQHYILPIMPVMAILIGILLEDMLFIRDAFSHKFASDVFRYHVIVIGICTILGSGFIIYRYPVFGLRAAIVALIALFFIGAATLLLLRQKSGYGASLIFGGIVVVSLLCRGFFMPDFDGDIYAKRFALEIRERIPGTGTLSAYQHVSSRFVQYYGKTVPVIVNQEELKEAYEKGDWIYCDLENMTRLKTVQDVNIFSVAYSKTEIPSHVRKGDYGGVLFHRPDVLEGE